MYIMTSLASVCFPPSEAIVSDTSFKNGKMAISYAVSDKDRQEIIDEFEEQITNIVKASVAEGDSPAITAIALHHYYSSIVSYDYPAADNDATTDVSCYRGLTELSGICQSFASAYAYLCLQCGIDSVPASGITVDDICHEWTLIKLDGDYYYVDPTYENGNGGNGLQYFGITSEKRNNEDGYVAEYSNIGNTNVIWEKDLDISSKRFSDLWDIVNVNKFLRKDGKLWIYGEKSDGTEAKVVVE